jgi:hypothetical protein
MLTRMTTSMQEPPIWPVMLCGTAARRAVSGMGGTTEQNPRPPEEAPSKNPLPAGEGRVRVVRQSFNRPAFARPNPRPGRLPGGEGGPHRAPGKVIAVFARSFYLANAAGELACIGPPGLGRGPLNMLCDLPQDLDWQARGLRPGHIVPHLDEALHIAGIGSLLLADAVVWRPPPPSTWDAATLVRGLAALAAATHETSADGFAPLVAALARGGRATACATPLLQLAAPGIVALADWLAAPVKDALQAAAALLVGLGPGLTPSGDDLVGGAMIALHTLGRADMAKQLADWALPLAVARTGAISLAHLACAAGGEGCAALHDLLAALLRADEKGLARPLAALAGLGHSSGWDMLAGATLACASFSAGR